jgi:hypothetical protein
MAIITFPVCSVNMVVELEMTEASLMAKITTKATSIKAVKHKMVVERGFAANRIGILIKNEV